MVRTKDLLLIVVVLVMLVMAISATVATRVAEQSNKETGAISWQNTQELQYGVSTGTKASDGRQENISRLRELIAKGDVIESFPSVEAPAVIGNDTNQTHDLNCISPNTGIDTARNWPLSGVEIKLVGTERVVSKVSYSPVTPVATGTQPVPEVLNEINLLNLPLLGFKASKPACIDNDVIGVTIEGSLIFNTDAILYRNTSPETLIGYARDGFPIYGAYAGTQDQCGGYDSSSGYRYAASPTGDLFISCFMGAPRTFSQ